MKEVGKKKRKKDKRVSEKFNFRVSHAATYVLLLVSLFHFCRFCIDHPFIKHSLFKKVYQIETLPPLEFPFLPLMVATSLYLHSLLPLSLPTLPCYYKYRSMYIYI
ncbi:hypothetical protein, unlikely [Trypanosoma brucei gambiense DAL972]|uniref:Uncharacterized protein n=1 Tax=Trypanosoma brucei gambiense (strain MHOM/CI/86/DAL972) TaxID=679716 RepID=C9ZZ73_TRYB9|nr:hypothetical protein, unlikely [Trypanosoma brucei gambiense DAL972]CBH14722.1 hypothetical protein, unlikely [Trypanosoma brucei gambiense DAL972]|eukprot:XP_011776988.1 hypothetical protein, unlikely [Trypanosoma brucei gambiense DAL972]